MLTFCRWQFSIAIPHRQCLYSFKFPWNLFLGFLLTESQHWSRQQLDAKQTSDDSVHRDLLMAQPKTAVTPLLTHWSYCSLALSHRYMHMIKPKWLEQHQPLWNHAWDCFLHMFSPDFSQWDTLYHMVLKLLDKMCKYEMDPKSIIGDTDGHTNRRTRWNQ